MNWKILGVLLSLIGCVATFASDYVDDKKMEQTIESEVKKQLSENKTEES